MGKGGEGCKVKNVGKEARERGEGYTNECLRSEGVARNSSTAGALLPMSVKSEPDEWSPNGPAEQRGAGHLYFPTPAPEDNAPPFPLPVLR